MVEKMTLNIEVNEDGFDLKTTSGNVLCSVSRDEDSYASAVRVLESIGFNIEVTDTLE